MGSCCSLTPCSKDQVLRVTARWHDGSAPVPRRPTCIAKGSIQLLQAYLFKESIVPPCSPMPAEHNPQAVRLFTALDFPFPEHRRELVVKAADTIVLRSHL